MAESNSPDLAGGVESMHAWAEVASRLGSKLLEAFYVQRVDAVVVRRTEDDEGVNYFFDSVERLDVGDLAERLRNAERKLKDLAVTAEVAERSRDARRLYAKATGVALALSYVEEMTRG